MAATLRPEELVDNAVVDAQGRKIGKVGTVYLSDESRQPEWVTVRTGLFGHKESFVPLQGAHLESDGVHVQVSKDQVSEAPRTDTDADLSGEESAQLYRHYDLPAPRAAMPEESTQAAGTAPAEGTRQEATTEGESAETGGRVGLGPDTGLGPGMGTEP
ncbi:PRC-barrel domain-containing protein, partial [Saccharomonospora saliphila]|uniref:PRC-barrel domain-containing protein n=1 Tax=Saccharomonospora saliphila TaxID=369829 RepID=UPI00036277EF